MIPNPHEVSAFAVYSGIVGVSKSKQRRNRHKRVSNNNDSDKSNDSNMTKKLKKTKKPPSSVPKKKKLLKLSNVNLVIDQLKKDKLLNAGNKKVVKINKSDKAIAPNSKKNNVVIKNKKVKKVKQVPSPKSAQSNSLNIKRKDSSFAVTPSSAKTKFNSNVVAVQVVSQTNQQVPRVNQEVPQVNQEVPQVNQEVPQVNQEVRQVNQEVLQVNQEVRQVNQGVRLANNLVALEKKRIHQERVAKSRELRAEKKKQLQKEAKQQIKGRSSTSSVNKGKSVFESLITPFKVEEFFSEYWEKKPLFIDRGGNGDVFSQYLSTAEMDTMLRYNMLMFGRNIDITSYSEGVRETHNPEGRAHPHVVWDYYSNGCSVRVLNPQTYLNKIHTLLASLQEYFGCFVGSNIYLTPPNTQGFAPHYDDIEAFVLQIEGSKHWRVYKPRNASEELPRFSSRNFNQDEIGSPILEVTLKPGDLLYFPRGFVHQAEALPDQHSLHITISTYQKTTWLDLMEQAIPDALARAGRDMLDFRRGLPIGYLRGAGLAYSSMSLKSEMISKLRKLVSHLEKYLDIDDAVDKLGLNFIHQALPPVLTQDESECSVHNGGLKMVRGELMNRVDLSLKTKIRWIRANAFRIVEDKEEESQIRLYHCVDNSKEYEAEDLQFVVIDRALLPAVLHLTKAYPAYTQVSHLPCSTDDEKLVLAGDLWDRGLVISEKPLESNEEAAKP